MRTLTAFLLALSLSGCHVLSDAERRTIAVNAAAGRADVRAWDTMTPAQQREAFVGSTAGYVSLDYSANGREPGPEWRAILDAPKPEKPKPATSDAETPR